MSLEVGHRSPGGSRSRDRWVILAMSASELEFWPRSRWWARHFGPWRLERSDVREIYPGRPHPFYSWTPVNFVAQENMPWIFMAEWPERVLGAAEQLG